MARQAKAAPRPDAGKKQGKVGKGSPPEGTRFRPGQSGNPKGKSKGTVSLTAELRRQLSEGQTAEQIVRSLILNAAKGNGAAMKIVWDRIDGPVKEETEHSGGMTIRIVDDTDDKRP